MKILALEPYYAGSHRAFLDGWIAYSRHDWSLLTLPGNKWKWRMRHAAFTFAEQIEARSSAGEGWDLLFTTDMLDLAQLLGLARRPLGRIPSVVYFHENQLTYPSVTQEERDYHFAMTNFATAAAADAVWFNSYFHKSVYLTALQQFLKRMPNRAPFGFLDRIQGKAAVFPPGVSPPPERPPRRPGVLRLLWAARWEYDKNPEDFFAALRLLRNKGVEFRLSVIGEQFETVPETFALGREEFADRIDCWGYQESRAGYEKCLSEADVLVSTAVHEFFGISVVEAAAAGVFPVLPRRLAYPEIFDPVEFADFYYDGTVPALVGKVAMLAERLKRTGSVWNLPGPRGSEAVRRFFWPSHARDLDEAIEASRRERSH